MSLGLASLSLMLGCSAASGGGAASTSTQALSAGGESNDKCPGDAPVNGSPCVAPGLECSWGQDLRFGCRTQAVCANDGEGVVWQVWTASCPEPAPSCPRDPPAAGDAGVFQTPCSEKHLGLTCVYGDVAYTCANCTGTLCMEKPAWAVTSFAASCPEAVPNFGDACSIDGLYCNYNVCADDQIPGDQWAYGIGMRCDGGQWQFYAQGACP